MEKNYSQDLLNFISKSYTGFHAVENIKAFLNKDGFKELKQNDIWDIVKGGKYYTTSNDSSIIAFKIGKDIEDYSFNIVASHTDSPTFKIKPNCSISLENHYLKLNTEPYGGILFSTWFDRPLSIAGRVFVKNKGNIENKLLCIDKDLMMIPSLAIHMNREANSGYKYNAQVDLLPFMGVKSDEANPLLALIAQELEVAKEDIISSDLFLYPRNHGYIWGLNNEFLSISRLDDLECAYTSLVAFSEAEADKNINVYCAFDNEEVGSSTKQGAASTLLIDTLKRINSKLNYSPEKLACALASSTIISADNAHAVHPNHPQKSDETNRVYMNEGVVIKSNANQKYTTDALSSSIFKSILDDAKVPYQSFTNRSDMAGGGTLGSISSSQVSIMSVDIGLAQLAMHSSFETAGALDVEHMINALRAYYSTHIYKDGSNIIISK